MKKFRSLFFIISVIVSVITHADQIGFDVAGIPIVKYNSDEGLGYGVNIAIYNHGDGTQKPYFYLIQSEIVRTQTGPRHAFIFFDSPFMINDFRIIGDLRYQNDVFSPFYGIGNSTKFDPDQKDLNPDFYRFGRRKTKLTLDLQRDLFSKKLRGLIGLGLFHTTISANSNSLLDREKPIGIDGGWTNYLKLGVIYDTRDNEASPKRGVWAEILIEHSPTFFASDYGYTRFTLTDRLYFPIFTDRLIYAVRFVYEAILSDAPFYELAPFGSSFRKEEGLGGAKSLRGILKNRWIGKTKYFTNNELRWRIIDFQFLDQNFYLAANLFLDMGRVDQEAFSLVIGDYHVAKGGGLRIGWNENFIIAVDLGNSDEVPIALYIGLGYLY